MKFVRFSSTGDPVRVKAGGTSFTVSDGHPTSIMLTGYDHERETLDVWVRPGEPFASTFGRIALELAKDSVCLAEDGDTIICGPTECTCGRRTAASTTRSPDRWRQISDIDRGQIADELHLKAVARYATGGQRRGDFYAEDPLDEAEDEFIDGAFYIALARRERTEHRARLAAAEAKVRELETKIRELVKQLVDPNA